MANVFRKPIATKESEIDKCKDFFTNFKPVGIDTPPYLQQLQEIVDRERTSLEIYLDDLAAYQQDNDFVATVIRNTNRYTDIFAAAADACLPKPSIDESDDATVFDVWMQLRAQRLQETQERNIDSSVIQSYPTQLLRKYDVRIIHRSGDKPLKLREIRADHVGSLVSVRGVVIRTTDVQPLVQVQTYVCIECGYESYQTVESREYTPLQQCPSDNCRENRNKGKLLFQVRGSKFRKYQEIKLQELPTEVPVGHIPRSMTLRVFGDLVRTMKPGDVVTSSGIFLPSPYSGFRAIRAGLTTDTYLDVSTVNLAKKSYNEMVIDDEQLENIERMALSPDIYDHLSQSISPEIYGHEDTKKAMLLSMVGGVTKTMRDGMRIRGDLNVLLVGDPGMAKSQLLKYITKLAPRAVYTTGKGSSGVGLTAAVIRDPLSGEMTLEGGALVLADQGICCIDEFDKMEEADRTAIHEVMEQQTVSIAKAGITTTLNARTTVLAAANPAFGRYNKRRSLGENLNMPAALLSRFDLVFVMLDKPNAITDEDLSRHITYVHRENRHPPLAFQPLNPALVRAYIARAKTCEPFISPDLEQHIADCYVSLRRDSAQEDEQYGQARAEHNDRERFCTARSLLSILRLAQAVARVHIREMVVKEDVDEALRLMDASKQALYEDEERRMNPQHDIFNLISRLRDQKNKAPRLLFDDIERIVIRKGYTIDQLRQCVESYQDDNVWQISRDRKELIFLVN